MYRFYVEWIFVQRNERGFSYKKKKKKGKKREIVCPEKTKMSSTKIKYVI